MTPPFNACDYLLDRHIREGRGDRLALTGVAGGVSYADLAERVGRAARGLRGLGLQAEQRVVMVMADSPEFVIVYLAAMRIGAVPLFFAGPTFFAGLLRAGLPADALPGVRLAASAGEALPAALYQRWTSHFGIDILDGIGMTEMLHIFLSNRPGQVKAGTTGVADEETLIGFCKTGLPSFKRPRRIVFVTEYPTTATGKIRRVDLRVQAAVILQGEPRPAPEDKVPADPAGQADKVPL